MAPRESHLTSQDLGCFKSAAIKLKYQKAGKISLPGGKYRLFPMTGN
jgi:hypothetical protein